MEISGFFEENRLDENRGVRLREKSKSRFSSFFQVLGFFEKPFFYVIVILSCNELRNMKMQSNSSFSTFALKEGYSLYLLEFLNWPSRAFVGKREGFLPPSFFLIKKFLW